MVGKSLVIYSRASTLGLTRHTADARSLMNIILLLKDPLISQASPRLSGGALVGLNLVSFSAVRERARKEQSSGIATRDREGVMGGSEENPLSLNWSAREKQDQEHSSQIR